jgi:hypothetical protein|tara:strand:- start:457 stop:714 length:258 start_codon:yes stop_codon:yes gene_type:complete
MPKYGGVHYPNDIKGKTNGYPTHVPNDDRGITKGYPEHVPNKDGGLYGDFTNKSIADGGVGLRARKGVLNERDAFAWKYPNPVKT